MPFKKGNRLSKAALTAKKANLTDGSPAQEHPRQSDVPSSQRRSVNGVAKVELAPSPAGPQEGGTTSLHQADAGISRRWWC